MNVKLRSLPIEERLKLVEDLWDSIAADQKALAITPEQQAELDRRLDADKADEDQGRSPEEVIADIRSKL